MKLYKELSTLENHIIDLDSALSLLKALTYSCRDMTDDDVEKALHGMLASLERINQDIRTEFDKVWEADKKEVWNVKREKNEEVDKIDLDALNEKMNPPVLVFQVGDVEDPHLCAQMHISEKLPSAPHKYYYTLLNKDMGHEVRVYERQSV